jgi:hypothetical protein
MSLGDYSTGSTVFFSFTTVNSTGAPSAFTDGALTAYANGATVANTTGMSLPSTFAGRAGLNRVQVDMAGTSTFYLPGSHIMAVVSSGTVASQSIAGYVVGEWTVGRKPFVSVSSAVSVTGSSLVNVVEWLGVAPSTLGTNSHIQVSTTQGLGGAGSSLVNVVEWGGSTVGGQPYSSSSVNVAEWVGTAPSTLGTNGFLVASSTSYILGVTSVGSTVQADVALWRNTAPSTLATNNHLRISTAAFISTAQSIDGVTSVNSTVDAHVRAIGGSTLAAENVRYTMSAIGRVSVGVGSSATAIVAQTVTPTVIVADQYKGLFCKFDADTDTTALRGQGFIVSSNSTDASPVFNSTDPLTTAPSSNDTFSIY